MWGKSEIKKLRWTDPEASKRKEHATRQLKSKSKVEYAETKKANRVKGLTYSLERLMKPSQGLTRPRRLNWPHAEWPYMRTHTVSNTAH